MPDSGWNFWVVLFLVMLVLVPLSYLIGLVTSIVVAFRPFPAWTPAGRIALKSFLLALFLAPTFLGSNLQSQTANSAFALPGPAWFALFFAQTMWLRLVFAILPILVTWSVFAGIGFLVSFGRNRRRDRGQGV